MSAEFTLADLDRAMKACKTHTLPTISDSDGEHYFFYIHSARARDAFDLGMAPFCPVPRADLPMVGFMAENFP